MKKLMKISVIAVLCVVLIASFTACTGDTKYKEKEFVMDVELPSTHVGKVTVSTNALFMSDLNKLKLGFNKHYPNIQVVIKPQANNNETIVQWFNGDKKRPGTSPDIFWLTTGDYQPLANGGILKDLTAFVKEATEKDTVDYSDIKESMFNLGKTGFKKDGAQFLIPTQYDQFVTIINKTILDKAGIKIANPGSKDMTFTYTPLGTGATSKTINANEWTWSEFEEIAAKCKYFYDNQTQWGAIAPVTTHLESDSIITPILKSHGVEILDENGALNIEKPDQKAKLTAALTFMNSMVAKGYTSYVPGGAIDSGKIAMHFQSRPGLMLPDKTPGVEFPNPGYFGKEQADVVPFPAINIADINKPYVGSGSHGYAMYKFTQNPNEAWAFMQYILTQEGQNILGDAGLQVPILNSMNENHEGEDWNWLKKPIDTINHGAYISHLDRMVATDFHIGLHTKIQSDALTSYLKMAQQSTKDGQYETNINNFIAEMKAAFAKVR